MRSGERSCLQCNDVMNWALGQCTQLTPSKWEPASYARLLQTTHRCDTPSVTKYTTFAFCLVVCFKWEIIILSNERVLR